MFGNVAGWIFWSLYTVKRLVRMFEVVCCSRGVFGESLRGSRNNINVGLCGLSGCTINVMIGDMETYGQGHEM